jgi:ATP-dependent RNA helicase DDX52/ROK1
MMDSETQPKLSVFQLIGQGITFNKKGKKGDAATDFDSNLEKDKRNLAA